MLCATGAFAQSLSVTRVLNSGIGDTNLAPLTTAYIYGTFPKGAGRDFTITVGGQTGPINVADGTGWLTATIPANAPLGATTLTVNYQGARSNAFPITLNAYAPEFTSVSGIIVSDAGPTFPLPNYAPIFHYDTRDPVTAAAPAAPGEALGAYATGLGATNPPTSAGVGLAPLAVMPTLSINGANAPITQATGSGGGDEIDFFLPSGTANGSASITLAIGGVTSNTVTIPVGGQAAATITSVVSAGGFGSSGTIAPGSEIAIFGTGFGTADVASPFPSVSVNGVSVLFGTTPAPIVSFAAKENQINVAVPTELATSGTVDITVQAPNGNTAPFTVKLAPAVPGIFSLYDPNVATRRNAAALLANTAWVAMPTSMAAGLGIPQNCASVAATATCGQPAHAGDYLQVYVTGLGKATPNGDPNGASLPTGQVAPVSGGPVYSTVATPTVTIGGQPAPVLFSGLVAGSAVMYQLNIQVPMDAGTGDDVPLVVTMGSVSDTATIALAAFE